MNTSQIYFIIYCVIGIIAIAVLGYAFSQPLINLTTVEANFQVSRDIYITKECDSIYALYFDFNTGNCGELSSTFKLKMQAIMGLVIALMVGVFLKVIGMYFSDVVSNVLGLLVILIAVVTIILVATLTSFFIREASDNKTYYFELTNTSICILSVASLLVLFELCCNRYIHRVILSPYRLIVGKKG